jgi:CcmD family protein
MNVIATISNLSLSTFQNVEMADTFRDNGKIFVVVGVISIVFIGLAAYLFSLDRKITKIEKDLNLK